MGGTIDKAYPKSTGGYTFEICKPAASRILQRGNVSPPSCDVRVEECIRKDSQDITDQDRRELWELCYYHHSAHLPSTDHSINDSVSRFIITHGTDTMIKTGMYLSGRLSAQQSRMIIVLVGSKLPETFKDSDADFNLGVALGAVQSMGEDRTGVYIAMNGAVLPAHHASRNEADGSFFFQD
ncbi:hypothetical protein RvY_15536 [Ramazzottius varieornatus]|uniref:L-asparaginase N-terminal domain-containing protein n=1 Tax=Ramazzottius varieornatus TaxID=947166 RepID=A0A1D1VV92_RAMVA|nr:hypothetical protein RvY_15536 [Ramazzottius varieornatus]